MSQNDFNLANANGATFRADVNSAFQAIASCSSGGAAPGTTYGCQWWFDTANDILKIRDEANANWVNVASLVGTTWVPYSNGSVLGTLANLNAASVSTNLAMASNKSIAGSLTSVASGTPDFATMGNAVSLTSTATANTLGTTQAGFIGVIHYGVAITITHNGASRILPTAANIVTQIGDVEIVLSLGSGSYRTIAYMRADGSALGAAVATQAQMEAAASTSVFVSPGRAHFHPHAAKAWVEFVPQGTNGACTINSSYNVSGVSRTGAGAYTVTFATAFSSAAYAAICTPHSTTVGHNLIAKANTKAAGTCTIDLISASAGSVQDLGNSINCAFFGDL